MNKDFRFFCRKLVSNINCRINIYSMGGF